MTIRQGMVGGVSIAPPEHLSTEAQAHLADPPPPLVGFDATDPVAVAELRAELHPEWEAANEAIPGSWAHRADTIAGVPVVWFAGGAAAFDSTQVLVHLHGGAYFLGGPMTNAVIPVPIAQRTELPVVSIDYRLAPEHRCPAAVEDVTAVIAELANDREVQGLFGESAGGGLAVAATVALRDSGAALPRRLGLLSPWVDLTCSGDTYQTLAGVDPDFPEPADPPVWASAYAGELTADPQASPLFADLHDLPPTLIQVGGREILLSDSCRLQQALTDAGCDATLDIWDGLWHVWQMFPHVPEANRALDELAAFLVPTD